MPFRLIIFRYKRFYFHLLYPFYKAPNHLRSSSVAEWLFDLICYLLDLFFLPELYLLVNLLFKNSFRKINEHEKLLAINVFDDLLLLEHIFVDDKSNFLTKKHNFAYVGFNLINYWGGMRDEVFVHELMHIFQFQKFGLVYIYRALKAQYSKMAYDYGGIDGLITARKENKNLFDFNFEQQASIIEHYYIITQREDLNRNTKLLAIYKQFHNDLKSI
jgi:hypothetical protein